LDNRFREVYEFLFDNYQLNIETRTARGDEGLPISALIRGAIENAETQIRTRRRLSIRPDGRYFLLTNFYSMIFLPLLAANGRSVNVRELLSAVQNDILDIVETAADIEFQRLENSGLRSNQISGHVIMESVSQRWRYLKTTSFRLWGDE
jgi:hypothetical protein